MSLTADMADDSQKIKAYVVRAEDSRLMGDMTTMRKAYTELYSLNSQLLGGHNIRRSTHEGLISALKDVNNMIQKAANLRVGKIKTSVIADCRANVKTNNLTALLKIIKHGSENPTK
jgi:Bardet-Biedl syndrome 2 protein